MSTTLGTKYRTIPVGDIRTAIVDAEDYDKVRRYKWHQGPGGHVKASRRVGVNVVTIYLHRLILGDVDGNISHLNSDPLDNRKSNLRRKTRAKREARRVVIDER